MFAREVKVTKDSRSVDRDDTKLLLSAESSSSVEGHDPDRDTVEAVSLPGEDGSEEEGASVAERGALR